MIKKEYTFIDLFAGAGALDLTMQLLIHIQLV